MKKNINSKRGFNLIEIAIVLAVIGLVIGGIYVAASAVTDNQRKQKAQSQLLNVVSNLRNAYAGQQVTAAAVTGAALAAARVVPGDMTPTAANALTFNGAYGVVTIAGAASAFQITLASVSTSACVDFVSKNFSTVSARSQIGLTSLTVNGTAQSTTTDWTVATGATACTATAGNTLVFTFSSNV